MIKNQGRIFKYTHPLYCYFPLGHVNVFRRSAAESLQIAADSLRFARKAVRLGNKALKEYLNNLSQYYL